MNILKNLAAVAVVLSLLFVCGCGDENGSDSSKTPEEAVVTDVRVTRTTVTVVPERNENDVSYVDDYIAVPVLTGKYYEDLTPADYEMFDDVTVNYVYSDTYEKGQITSQSPAAGKHIRKSPAILQLNVSKGKQPLDLPLVSGGESKEQICSLLRSRGFVPVEIEVSSETVEVGKVVKIECEDETPAKGSTVYVYVSTGIE